MSADPLMIIQQGISLGGEKVLKVAVYQILNVLLSDQYCPYHLVECVDWKMSQ